MTGKRLCGYERDRSLLPDACFAEGEFKVEHKLIGGAKAGSALGRADDDRSRIFQKLLPSPAGIESVLNIADAMRVASLRPQPFHCGVIDTRTSGDHKVVVRHALSGLRSL